MVKGAWMKLRGDLTAFYRFLKVGSRGAGNEFSLVPRDRSQGNGMNLHQEKLRLNMRGRLVTGTGSQGSGTTSSLPEFKEHLDSAPSGSVRSRELDSTNTTGPFQLEIFYDSVSVNLDLTLQKST